MGGGGGGNPFHNRSPEQLASMVRKAEDATAVRAFETELSGYLNSVLASANSRDVEAVSARLSEIEGHITDQLHGAIDLLFGGSVAKHTYVDGMSDVDSLLLIDNTDLASGSPKAALEKLALMLRDRLGSDCAVSVGQLAVTVRYQDGLEVQLLPALRIGDGFKVPSATRDGWSRISPRKFQDALTQRNSQCGGKLVPTIKLAKAVLGNLPEARRLSGYHVESLAIAAFRDYNGPKTVSAMLPTFFEKARTLVLQPIRDSTGQSVHVDGYLGGEDSQDRKAASHLLGRIGKRMRNASAHMSKEQWSVLFEGI